MNSCNVAIVGCGTWGAQHAKVYSRLSETRLVAVCDVNESSARRLAAEHGVNAIYTDFRQLLEDNTIDAVSVATPDFAHTEVIIEALKAGKHVLSEKPLALNETEATAVERAANTSDRVLMVDFHNRASPVFLAARNDIQQGLIGKPLHCRARLSNTLHVPQEMLSWASRSSALWFLGSHVVDMLRFLLDDEVEQVSALSRSGLLQSQSIDTADVHLSLLSFSRNTLASMENSWVLPKGHPQIFDFQIDIIGDEGQLSLNPSHHGAYQLTDANRSSFRDMFGEVPVGGHRVGGFVLEAIARFVDCIMDGAPPLATVEDGVQATRVLLAIEKSAETGESVALAR